MGVSTLYVGNLSWETSADELAEVFGEYGEVKAARVITDSATGRSKGFGFVEMTAEAARQAQAQINGARLRGRALVVAPANSSQA